MAETTDQVVPPRVGDVVTVTGVVRTVEALWPDGHYRITVDGAPSTAGPLTDAEAHEVYMAINYLDDELGSAREVIDQLIAGRVRAVEERVEQLCKEWAAAREPDGSTSLAPVRSMSAELRARVLGGGA